MERKVKVSSDVLFEYMTEHGVKMLRLAELTGLSDATLHVCFKHMAGSNGQPRTFTPQAVKKINEALPVIANELRGCMLAFGSNQTRTNSRGTTYDPALVEPLKNIGLVLNLTALVTRVLGWSKQKKDSILVTKVSKVYGNISQADVDRVNTELLAVAAVLSSYEVVADNNI